MKNQFPDLTYVLSFPVVLGHWQPYCSIIFHYFFLPPLYALILFDRIKGVEICIVFLCSGVREQTCPEGGEGIFLFFAFTVISDCIGDIR